MKLNIVVEIDDADLARDSIAHEQVVAGLEGWQVEGYAPDGMPFWMNVASVRP